MSFLLLFDSRVNRQREITETEDDSEPPDPKLGRDDEDRYRQIRRWAEYVRTHDADEWGPQVNELIESQLAAARAQQFDRSDLAHMRDPAEEDNDIQRPEIARENGNEDTGSPANDG